ncbi:MAG: PLP-dependent aminotransferase family protein [Oscillospiraceae bacterium]|jgi:GntR family transcriptional regulator/MocR family aminotransferase|nr:PLP-dependent aminotransferase family protein [Oscillospiraceae bacterium]
MPLIPPLDRNRQTPLYEQIYRYLRAQIENGALKSEEALPSRRMMAALCGVSTTTVWNAYEQLAAEGYIAAKPKSGTYVEGPERNFTPVTETGEAPPEENKPPPVRYDCRFGRIDESAFPHKLWHAHQQAALRLPEVLQRGDPQGELFLRREICGILNRLRGVEADPSAVIIGAGLEWLILALLPLFPETARFGMEDPGYTPYRKLLDAYGRKTLTVPSGSGAERLYDLQPDILYLQPSHRFPLGGVLPAKKRQELLQWAGKTGGIILEDDYDSELRYRGLPIQPLQSMDRDGRVVYLGSFSGSFSPALRIGYMILPPGLEERRRHTGHPSCPVSVPDQLALASFIQEGRLERHIARMRTLYRRRRERLLELFKRLEPDVTAEDDGAGLFLRLSLAIPEERALTLALEAGVRLTGISQFYEGTGEKTRVLFGYGGLSDDCLPEVTGLLARAWA